MYFNQPNIVVPSVPNVVVEDRYTNDDVQLFQGLLEKRDYSLIDKYLTELPRKAINMIVLGGSETAGIGCVDGNDIGPKCSWSFRVAKWLRRFGHVTYNNLARGGTTSASILPVIKFMIHDTVDLNSNTIVFIDYGVNDAMETSTTFNGLGINRQQGVSLALEKLILEIYSVAPSAAIIGFNVPLADAGRFAIINRAYESVYSTYQIPSFRMDLMRWLGKEIWHSKSQTHPNVDGHILFGNAIKFAFARIINRESNKLPRDINLLEKLPTCDLDNSNYYSAFVDKLSLSSTCKQYEDREGKPGYICDGDQEMYFQVKFGKQPRLMITYLQSYQNIDDATVTINNVSVTLTGRIDERVSQTKTTFYYADKSQNQRKHGMSGMQGFGVKPNSIHKATIKSVSGGKIKVVSLVSC